MLTAITLFFFAFTALLYAGRAPYVVDDILNEAKSEDNSFAINANFQALYQDKVSVSTGDAAQGIRYTITDIADTENAEENAQAVNENFVAAWNDLVEISGSTGTPRFLIIDLDDPKVADENAAMINELFEDLWAAKEDRQ